MSTIIEWVIILASVLVIGIIYEMYQQYKSGKNIWKEINKWKFCYIGIIILALLYIFLYKPYFTQDGIIVREMRHNMRLEKNVIYDACGLPSDHRFHKIFSAECKQLELEGQYKSEYQNCTPNYMGGCD